MTASSAANIQDGVIPTSLLVLEHIAQPAFAVTQSGRVRWANEMSRKHLVSRSEVPDTILEIVSGEDHASMMRMLRATTSERQMHAEGMGFRSRPSGDFISHTVRVFEIPAEPGTGSQDDERLLLLLLSEKTTAEPSEALAHERKRFDAFFHNASDALFLQDTSGRILDANHSAITLFGYSREELCSRTIGSLHPGGSVNARKDLDLSVGEVLVFDSAFASKRGETIPVRIRVQKILLGSVRVNVSTVTDQRREVAMREQMIRAEQLEAVSRMAGALSHDFNNLLMVALAGSSELIEAANLPSHLREAAEDVHRATEQASALASRLTGVARSQQPLEGTTDLCQHLLQIRRILETIAGDGVGVVIDVSAAPLPVSLHESQLTQILTNLVANASHAMAGSGTVYVSAEEIVQGDENQARLSVRDTGCGMPPEVLERIFEPLYTTKAGGVGTGLGLASVQAILELRGGVVDVQTEVGKGTTFELTFPRLGTTTAESPSVEMSEQPPASRGQVLIVDDVAPVRGVMARLLTRWGFSVSLGTDGQDGIDQIIAQEPGFFRLVITDMMMPRRSGAELADVAWSHDEDLPIVVLTAFSTELVPREDSHHLRCLSKPVQPERLRRAIEELISHSEEPSTAAGALT